MDMRIPTRSHSGEVRRRVVFALAVTATVAAALLAPPRAAVAHAATQGQYVAAVAAIEQLPYQPAYVPTGSDAAFPTATQPNGIPVVNTPPANDYLAGSIVGSNGPYDPTGVTGAPPWPSTFTPETIPTPDATRITGWYHAVPGLHPGIVVVHGFNTHGVWSVIRWAALLAADGYNVAAFDQRDFSDDTDTTHPQTFGWKEAQDVLTAGRWLAQRPGVTSVGVVGFSEGAQNTLLALGQDTTHVFSAGLTFSAPADQDTQVWGTRQPSSCTSGCQYPATDALVSLVVPSPTGVPYTDVCAAIGDAATAYRTTGFRILEQASAMHAQPAISVPLLNFYSADDSLVNSVQAEYAAAWNLGNPLQRTIEVSRGEHAYFFDRWWQQEAILTYFKGLLPSGSDVTTAATANQTSGGATFTSQEIPIPSLTPAAADAQLGPYVCDAAQGSPGRAASPLGAGNAGSPGASAGGPPGTTPGSAAAGVGQAGGSPNTAAARTPQALTTAALLAALGVTVGIRRRRRRADP
jgi:hypothetical protein